MSTFLVGHVVTSAALTPLLLMMSCDCFALSRPSRGGAGLYGGAPGTGTGLQPDLQPSAGPPGPPAAL